MKRNLFMLSVICLIIVLLLCSVVGCNAGQESATDDSAAEDSAAEDSAAEDSAAEDSTAGQEEGEKAAEFAWYGPLPHPYFEAVKEGVIGFEEEYGIEVIKQIGPEWTQDSENANVEALAAKGVKYFSIYPTDGSAANGLYEELTDRGNFVVSYGTTTLLPTTASFACATDVKAAAMSATENLIEMMGGKGNIINVLEFLEDSNTVLRKEGVEEVVAKYPDVEIIQEISGIGTAEEAVEKIESILSANIEEVDGIIATGYTTTVGIAQTLDNFYETYPDKKIYSIGIDTDEIVLDAIRNGVMDATISQNPYGHGYLTCLILKYLSEGYTVKEGEYFIDGGYVVVTKDNVDTFQDEVDAITQEIKDDLTTKYLEK